MQIPEFEFPGDCLELVHSRDSFVFDDWVDRLDNIPVFRISGITDAVESVGIKGRQYIQPLRLILEHLDGRVPSAWKEYYPAKHAWTQLGDPQINKNLQQSLPQSFDRALLSIVYVAAFIERVLHKPVPANFLELVKIVPVPYYLVTDDDLWSSIKGERVVAKLVEALGHVDDAIVKMAIKDHCRMTWRTAEIIQTVLAKENIDASIECSSKRKPVAIPNEPLFASRKVQHPAVAGYMKVKQR